MHPDRFRVHGSDINTLREHMASKTDNRPWYNVKEVANLPVL